MLTIRLSRVGKKKQPTYRFVVQEKGRDPWGSHVEIVGHCNLRAMPALIVIKGDRVKYWISQGAQPSDTVWNMLIDQKIVDGEKRKTVTVSRKKKAKFAEVATKAAAETVEKARKAKEAQEAAAAPAPEVASAVPETTPEETTA